MKCVKCGTEYEGNECPRCNGPVIKINSSDYMARRKAYEKLSLIQISEATRRS